MKKIFILLVALISLFTTNFGETFLVSDTHSYSKMKAQQQTVPARDYNEEFPDEDQVNKNSIVVKVGLNLASEYNESLVEFMEELGYEKRQRKGVKVGLEGMRNYGLFLIGSELAYSQKGSLYEYDDGVDYSTIEAYMDYLDVGFILGLDIPVASSFRVLPRVKPYFGLFLSGEVVATLNGEELEREATIKTVGDYGVGVGLDFIIANKIVLAALYDHGFANNREETEGFNRVFTFSIGYNIDLTRGLLSR